LFSPLEVAKFSFNSALRRIIQMTDWVATASRYLPFLAWIGAVDGNSLKADLMAGLTGAVIVLPQSVAFAVIAGLPPEYGLYTAMITPIIAALFGSSMHLISGPTTAISLVVFSTVVSQAIIGTPEFISLVLTLTFLAGVFQFTLGVARLGIVVNFVSHSVVVGFTAGAAILIATSQMKNMLGVEVPIGESFMHTWVDLWQQLGEVNYWVVAIGVITLASAILSKRFLSKLPNLLVGLAVGCLAGLILHGDLHGVRYVGSVPASFPPSSSPDFSFSTFRLLAPGAFAVALLGLIEAVSISRMIATKSHQRIDANQEFIGQGLSNIVGSFFSCYAGSGSFTRSGVNYDAGAKTPISAIFAAGFLMLIILLVAPVISLLPAGALAGIILLVAYNLIDFKEIKHILESSKAETSILLATFFATLFLELEFAIYLGVLLSLIIFLGKTSTPEVVTLAPDMDYRYERFTLTDITTKPLTECPRLKILRVDMSIYFGSVNYIQSQIHKITETEKVFDILLIGEGINLIDLTGAEMLSHEAARLDAAGGGLYFACLKPQVYRSISRTHLIKEIGNAHFFDDRNEAIRTLTRLLRMQGKCEGCEVDVFRNLAKKTDRAAGLSVAEPGSAVSLKVL